MFSLVEGVEAGTLSLLKDYSPSQIDRTIYQAHQEALELYVIYLINIPIFIHFLSIVIWSTCVRWFGTGSTLRRAWECR
jgi:hypothetical protein